MRVSSVGIKAKISILNLLCSLLLKIQKKFDNYYSSKMFTFAKFEFICLQRKFFITEIREFVIYS